LLPDLAPDFAWSAAAAVVMLSSLLSIPGLVLSVRGLRLARKRQAPEGLAMAGLVLGIVGTVLLVLAVVFASVFFALFILGMSHGS
jgi:cytochrome c biogenesis protein ResB